MGASRYLRKEEREGGHSWDLHRVPLGFQSFPCSHVESSVVSGTATPAPWARGAGIKKEQAGVGAATSKVWRCISACDGIHG